MLQIEEVLRQRGDLSTFIVHLTRGDDPYATLVSILLDKKIEARHCFGFAKAQATDNPGSMLEHRQRTVCFTETPLHFVRLMCDEIEHKGIQFAPYGVAFTRTYARAEGVNPVWYLDTTHRPGEFRKWLTNDVTALIGEAMAKAGEIDPDDLGVLPIFRLTPFIETMGRTPSGSRKEFWWEREWRKVGSFAFNPKKVAVVLAPEQDHDRLRTAVAEVIPRHRPTRFVDVNWATDQIEESIYGLGTEPFPP